MPAAQKPRKEGTPDTQRRRTPLEPIRPSRPPSRLVFSTRLKESVGDIYGRQAAKVKRKRARSLTLPTACRTMPARERRAAGPIDVRLLEVHDENDACGSG